MMKIVLIELSTDMANKELAEWVTRAIERQNETDPARRKAELAQKPHAQAVKRKKDK